MHNRRSFVTQLLATTGLLSLSWKSWASSPISLRDSLTVGLIADPHKDLVHDAESRLEAFIKACEQKKPDIIIQMGDFCHPLDSNKGFLTLFKSYSCPKYHILGNHDMDEAAKEKTLDFWGAAKPYYSFDHKGVHFVVLDANFLYQDGKFIDYEKANFYVDSSLRTFVHPEQIEWLKGDLEATDNPVLVFSHQSLCHEIWGVKNRLAIQQVMEEENARVGKQKVVACFNGHNHIDFHRTLNGIHYIDINSMAYQWLGDKFTNKTRYPESVYESHPAMAYVAPYKDPLYSFLEIDTAKGFLTLEGTRSSWVQPSPDEAGVPPRMYGSEYSPIISNRSIDFS